MIAYVPDFLGPVPPLIYISKFENISHFLSPRETPPSMLLDRTDEEDGVTLPSPATRMSSFLATRNIG